jgi:hypothetical protein
MSSGGYSIAPSPNYAAYANPNFGQQLGQIIANYPNDYYQGTQQRRQLELQKPILDPKTGEPSTDPHLVASELMRIGGADFSKDLLPFLQKQPIFDKIMRENNEGGYDAPPSEAFRPLPPAGGLNGRRPRADAAADHRHSNELSRTRGPLMAEHEPCIGQSDDCSPGPDHWVPARAVFTKRDDGLSQPWHGLVFMNPPFGGRNGQVPWLCKFFDHANGIAIVPTRPRLGFMSGQRERRRCCFRKERPNSSVPTGRSAAQLGLFVVLRRPPCAGNASDGLSNGGGARAAVCTVPGTKNEG